jgi:hypothetical protein
MSSHVRSFLVLSLTSLISLSVAAGCQKKASNPPPGPAAGPSANVVPPPASPGATQASPADQSAAAAAFMAACQAAGGLQKPAAAGQAVACACGNQVTSLGDFLNSYYQQDKTGKSFETSCSKARTPTTTTTTTPTHGTTGTPVTGTPVTGTPATGTPLSAADQAAAAAAFQNGCQAVTSLGAIYYSVSAGADEPQCLCGESTISLSYFAADAVAGFLANKGDPQAVAFQNSCKASLNAFYIANGIAPSGNPIVTPGTGLPVGKPSACGCQLETDFPTCDGCTVHNWCVLRDAGGNLVSYTDRTLVSDGLANGDCSTDCPYLAGAFGAQCASTSF